MGKIAEYFWRIPAYSSAVVGASAGVDSSWRKAIDRLTDGGLDRLIANITVNAPYTIQYYVDPAIEMALYIAPAFFFTEMVASSLRHAGKK